MLEDSPWFGTVFVAGAGYVKFLPAGDADEEAEIIFCENIDALGWMVDGLIYSARDGFPLLWNKIPVGVRTDGQTFRLREKNELDPITIPTDRPDDE